MSALVALALIVTTTLLQRATDSVARDTADAFVATELENELLNHARLGELLRARSTPELRRERLRIESRLEELIREAERSASGARETSLVQEAHRQLDAVVTSARMAEAEGREGEPPPSRALDAALGLLQELQQLNEGAAAGARAHAARVDRVANVVGGLALALIAFLVAAVSLSRRYVSRPLAGITEAIRHFRLGAPARRAPEDAPEELSRIARAFNETAEALAGQRQVQLAFIGGVAHDLRTPLNALKTGAGVLAKACGRWRDPAVDRTLAIVQRQVDRIDRMVTDLLDAARIEAGELRLKVQPVDICATVKQCAEMFEGPSGSRDVKVTCPGDPLTVDADPGRLEQVVVNLLENAIKYSPPGAPVEVEVAARDDEAWLSVTDRGAGIAPGDLEHIFEPFRRGNGSGAIAPPGAGLGLSIVRRIVAAHGGRIEVESALSQGSTFRVRLPLSRGHRGDEDAERAEVRASAKE